MARSALYCFVATESACWAEAWVAIELVAACADAVKESAAALTLARSFARVTDEVPAVVTSLV